MKGLPWIKADLGRLIASLYSLNLVIPTGAKRTEEPAVLWNDDVPGVRIAPQASNSR